MYVNATYVILCNNYGNDLPLPSQASLGLVGLLGRDPAAPPAEPSPWVRERLQTWELSPTPSPLPPHATHTPIPPPCHLLGCLPLSVPPFSHQTTHTPPSSTDSPRTRKTSLTGSA